MSPAHFPIRRMQRKLSCTGTLRTASALLLLCVFGISGCANRAPHAPFQTKRPAELLSQAALFGSALPQIRSEQADILSLSPPMREFLNRRVSADASAYTRLRQLLKGMIDEGYLSLEYDLEVTVTAAQAFERRIGNCLSFTNLFVALARAAGLQASYQLVDIPPVWSTQGDWVMLDKHINVIVKNGSRARAGVDQVVDFNIEDFQGNYPVKRISDKHAFALYFNNLGVEAMRNGDSPTAFAYFKRAILLNPEIGSPWVNLGALFARNGYPEFADSAYRQALRNEPSGKSALVNLARLHRDLGNPELASYYDNQVRRYRDANPYYHYGIALSAYRKQNWNLARDALDKALRLKKEEHQFHFLNALLFSQAGNQKQAKRSLEQALAYADQSKIKARYAAKLQKFGIDD